MTHTTPAMNPACRMAVVVPFRNEARHLQSCLDSLHIAARQVTPRSAAEIILVDNGSDDGSTTIAQAWRHEHHGDVTVHLAHEPTEGVGWARQLGARIALARAAARPRAHSQQFWLIGTDSDCIVAADWLQRWADATTSPKALVLTGDQDFGPEWWAKYPVAERINRATSNYAAQLEQAFGAINTNGNNHAIERSAYAAAGPYVQPHAITAGRTINYAGEDWDIGTRARALGLTVARETITVLASPRRFAADPAALFTGDAYEGPFQRAAELDIPAKDISPAEEEALRHAAIQRLLLHFACKPLLADSRLHPLAQQHLGQLLDWTAWQQLARRDSILTDRNAFIFQVLARFWSNHAVQVAQMASQLAGSQPDE